MDNLLKVILSFGAGYFVARYLMLNKYKDEYPKVEKQVIDKIQNKLHDWFSQAYPDADDMEIADTVLKITTGESVDQAINANDSAPSTSSFAGNMPSAQASVSKDFFNDYDKI